MPMQKREREKERERERERERGRGEVTKANMEMAEEGYNNNKKTIDAALHSLFFFG